MTPAARVQAAIDLLDEIIVAARDGGPAADTLIARYFKTRRYAGSKDRRAVRDFVYDAIRRAGERPPSGRAAMVGLAGAQPELAILFDGSAHAPAPLTVDEARASAAPVPAWIMSELTEAIDARELVALLERAPLDLRVNRLKARNVDLPEAVPIAGLPDGLRLAEGFPIERHPAAESGAVEVQDAGSQLISIACGARPGMTVIDLCAGAGGKTLALAADMKGQGRLIAVDSNRARLQRLPPRAERAGATFIETRLIDAGHEARMLADLHDAADVVLIDAPCSGTGTWRRNPEARWRLNAARLDRLVAEQARILDFAAPLVKPGGRLLFAVCALTEREGRGQAAGFLRRHSGWRAEPLDLTLGRRWGDGMLLTPAYDGSDGFFFASLICEHT